MEKTKDKIERKKIYILDINEQLVIINEKKEEFQLEKSNLLEKNDNPTNDNRKLKIINKMIKEIDHNLFLLNEEEDTLNSGLSRLKEDLSKDIVTLDIMIQDALDKESDNLEFYEPTDKDLEDLKRQLEDKYIEPVNISQELNPMNENFNVDAFADQIESI